jgi:hypothetical protein
MKIQCLISTSNKSDDSFLKKIFQNVEEPSYLVVNQIFNGGVNDLADSANFFSVKDKGLSKSRNLCISKANAEIGVISDDDVTYLPNFQDTVRRYHEVYSNYEIIAFKVMTPEGEPYKTYEDQVIDVNLIRAGYISSIELTFKINKIKEAKVKFNEQFGLGTNKSAGEEWIFLRDALRAGLKILFVPEYIVIHSAESSGKLYTSSRVTALSAVQKEIYGIKEAIKGTLKLIYWAKTKPELNYLQHINFPKFCYSLFKGLL